MIPAGLPGAGHLMCYDNGVYNQASRAVEIDPASGKLVWDSHQPGVGRKHFSDILGSAQRMKNGNTLINDGGNGRFFQVTSLSQTVWEYMNPIMPVKKYQGFVFKIQQYAQDYCPQLQALGSPAGPMVVPPPPGKLRVPNAEGGQGTDPSAAGLPDGSSDIPNSGGMNSTSLTPEQKHPDIIPLPIALLIVALLAGILGVLLKRKKA